jgi:5-methylcytosine-specific restriction endonuclease McrA
LDTSARGCPRCAETFVPHRRSQKYCSPTCHKEAVERVCAYCGELFVTATERKIYCGTKCAETVKADRYEASARAKYGEQLPPEQQRALAIKRQFVARGGYGVPGRTVPVGRRAEVFERDGGLCQICGKPGSVVDHTAGDHSELENLRLLCRECHDEVTDAILGAFADYVETSEHPSSR